MPAQSVLFVLGLAAAAAGFIGIVFAANKLLSPRVPTPDKVEPYECGMDPAGSPWAPVRVRYISIALLFVLFDAEAVLLFAVASKLHGSWIALIEVAAFVAMLALGLLYAWRKGALTWHS